MKWSRYLNGDKCFYGKMFENGEWSDEVDTKEMSISFGTILATVVVVIVQDEEKKVAKIFIFSQSTAENKIAR